LSLFIPSPGDTAKAANETGVEQSVGDLISKQQGCDKVEDTEKVVEID
jgi:hypothetical protein